MKYIRLILIIIFHKFIDVNIVKNEITTILQKYKALKVADYTSAKYLALEVFEIIVSIIFLSKQVLSDEKYLLPNYELLDPSYKLLPHVFHPIF